MADYDEVMYKLDYLDDTKQQIREAIVEKGETITDSDTFRAYVDKIKQLSNGDIRLFNTINEMNNDQKPKKEGDLAVVYNREVTPINRDSVFSAVVIPSVINIGSVSNENRTLRAYSNGRIYSSMYVSIYAYDIANDTGTMTLNLSNNKDRIEMTYQGSNGGLTYTFDYGYFYDSQGNMSDIVFDENELIFDFLTNMRVENCDDIFVGLFRVRCINFQGLFEYIINTPIEQTSYCGNNFRYDTNTNNIKCDLQDWIDCKGVSSAILTMISTNTTYRGISHINEISNHLPHQLTIYRNLNYLIKYNDKYYISNGRMFDTVDEANTYIESATTPVKIVFDFVNWEYNETNMNYTPLEVTVNEETRYIIVLDGLELTNTDLLTSCYFREDGGYSANICVIDITTQGNFGNYWYDFGCAYSDKYIIAPNQFNVTSNSDLVTNKIALGNDGIYTGDKTYLEKITTREYKDYFIPELPETKVNDYNYVIQNGIRQKYFTIVERNKMTCTDDLSVIPGSDAITIKLEPIVVGDTTSDTYKRAYNAEYHRTFFTKNNNKLYYGYFGYNMSDKESSSDSGGIVHEEFQQIYGVLVCLDDLTIIKEVNYTTTWRPFNGFGNSHEDPNANIIFLNYDFTRDEFVIFVDTGTWAWTGSDAPYIAMMKINGTTNNATTQSWKIGRNSVPNDYARVKDLRYDLTTQKLILPLNSWNKGDVFGGVTDRILKMDLSGNKTMWFNNNGKNIYDTSDMGGDESFYIFEPIYYYSYTDGTTTHYMLKRINDDRSLEIPEPYSMEKSYRVIYGGSLYYMCDNELENNKYPLIKVNLSSMTYETYGEFNSYYISFVLLDNRPHIVYGNALYDIDDLTTKKYTYYNNSEMYNDVRIDGVEYVDNVIQGVYPKATNNATNISFLKNRQIIHHWKVANEFPTKNELFIVYPSTIGDNVLVSNKVNLYNALQLSQANYDGTISPFDYQRALKTAKKIEGK